MRKVPNAHVGYHHVELESFAQEVASVSINSDLWWSRTPTSSGLALEKLTRRSLAEGAQRPLLVCCHDGVRGLRAAPGMTTGKRRAVGVLSRTSPSTELPVPMCSGKLSASSKARRAPRHETNFRKCRKFGAGCPRVDRSLRSPHFPAFWALSVLNVSKSGVRGICATPCVKPEKYALYSANVVWT